MTDRIEERLAAEAQTVDPGENEPTDLTHAQQTSQAARERAGQVVALRMPPQLWERIRAVASEQGIGPSTLMRQWLVDRLESAKGEADDLPEALDRLAHDVERVRQLTHA